MSERQHAAGTELVDLSVISDLDLRLDAERLRLAFGPGIRRPDPEVRTLAQVRPMLADPGASGPEHLYTIYMDICREEDRADLCGQGLLYGAVIYNHGVIGDERLRGQGHIHAEKPGTGLRYGEVFEFWSGRGVVLLQKEPAPVVTRVFLVPVAAGDRLVVPFGWVHLVVTVGDETLSFGAWCARANTLEYAPLRPLGGPCYYIHADGTARANPRYSRVPPIVTLRPGDLPDLGIPRDRPIYRSWLEQPERYRFLAHPDRIGDIWTDL